MGRKRNPVLPIFTRDILSSPRCRALSEQAAGIYFFLLCRLNEPPTPGAYRLRDWELHPTWKRSKTQQCLETPDKYDRLPYFAAMLAKNDLPWRQKAILMGLQELYNYKIIVVEEDMLIQPRMYKDNGFVLQGGEAETDLTEEVKDDKKDGKKIVNDADKNNKKKAVQKSVGKSAEKSTDLGTEKVQEKVPVSHAHAHSNEREIENNIDNNNKKKGVGKNVQDNPPTLEDIQAYMDERAAQGKPFIYVTAEGFLDACEQSGWTLKDGKPIRDWRARLRTFETYRKEHGDHPIDARQGGSRPQAPRKQGEAVPVSASSRGGSDDNNDKW